MITIMLSGALTKIPEPGTTKNGTSCITATWRTQAGESAVFASVTTFSALAGTLAGLAKGDPITVVGSRKYRPTPGKAAIPDPGCLLPPPGLSP